MRFVSFILFGFAMAYNTTTLFEPTRHLPSELNSRAPAPPPQSVSDPDSEGDWVDIQSGARTQKSRILDGLAPQDTLGRVFDWDETCSDPDDRAKILQAWQNVIVLGQESAQELTTLLASLPQAPGNTVNTPNRKVIATSDTAYTQMFRALDNALVRVRDIYNMFDSKANKDLGQGQRPDQANRGGLRFICNKGNGVKYTNNAPICGTDVQALTQPPILPNANIDPTSDIEPKYRFQWSTGIVFCPPFFDNTRFPSVEQRRAEALKKKVQDVTLDDLDCRERILLHEYIHVPWILDWPARPDEIGYENAARNANRNMNPRSSDPQKFATPDQFAWYAVYRSFNALLCDGNGKQADVWPRKVNRPCATSY